VSLKIDPMHGVEAWRAVAGVFKMQRDEARAAHRAAERDLYRSRIGGILLGLVVIMHGVRDLLDWWSP